MRALLDMPVSRSLLRILEVHGHEGVHAYEIGLERATDRDLLERARSEGRVILTADLDFPRLLALAASDGPGPILFRGGSYSDAGMRDLLSRVLATVSPEDLVRSICVVDRNRIRLTRLPLRDKPL